jgi:TonB family protein
MTFGTTFDNSYLHRNYALKLKNMKTKIVRSVAVGVFMLALMQYASLAQTAKKQDARMIPETELKSVETFDELALQYVNLDASNVYVANNAEMERAARTREKDEMTFRNVESFPAPESGLELGETLQELITYPECAIEAGLEGTVKVLVTVEKDGSVSNLLIVSDIGGKCAEEVCKVIRSVKFKPAMQNGYARRCNMLIPVVFELI